MAAGRNPDDANSLFSRLYAPDHFHPSILGSFLAASVLYGITSATSPSSLPLLSEPAVTAAVDAELQQTLREFAREALVSARQEQQLDKPSNGLD